VLVFNTGLWGEVKDAVYLQVFEKFYVLDYLYPPKDGIIALWPSTNGSIPDF